MKIAIPTDDKINVAYHFGRCKVYLCFDENGKETGEIKNTSEHMGGNGLPPELLHKNKVDILLCKDLGPNAIQNCHIYGIKVYKDNSTDKISELVRLWKANKITEAGLNDGCESHQ